MNQHGSAAAAAAVGILDTLQQRHQSNHYSCKHGFQVHCFHRIINNCIPWLRTVISIADCYGAACGSSKKWSTDRVWKGEEKEDWYTVWSMHKKLSSPDKPRSWACRLLDVDGQLRTNPWLMDNMVPKSQLDPAYHTPLHPTARYIRHSSRHANIHCRKISGLCCCMEYIVGQIQRHIICFQLVSSSPTFYWPTPTAAGQSLDTPPNNQSTHNHLSTTINLNLSSCMPIDMRHSCIIGFKTDLE